MYWIFCLLLNWTCSEEECKLKWVFACLIVNCEKCGDTVSVILQLYNLTETPDRRWKQIKVPINKRGNWGKPYLECQQDYLCHSLSQCNQPCQSDVFILKRMKMYFGKDQFISLPLNTVSANKKESQELQEHHAPLHPLISNSLDPLGFPLMILIQTNSETSSILIR